MKDSAAPVPPPRPGDRFLNVFATGLGTGYCPKGPGTAGSLLGPPLIWLLGMDSAHPWRALICGIIVFLIGIPICNAGIRVLRVQDPPQVVFDEIAAFFWIYLLVPINLVTAIAGFVLFRIFDISKPWLVRRAERLPGGLGIMADDAVAGLFSGIVLAISWYLYRSWGTP